MRTTPTVGRGLGAAHGRPVDDRAGPARRWPALAAGFVDAVVGGGGLIQLPALLLGAARRGAGADPGHQQAGLDLRHDGQLRDVLPPGPARPADVPAADAARLRRLGRAARWWRRHIPRGGLRPDRAGRAGRGRRLRAVSSRSSARRPRCGSPATGTPRPRCATGLAIGFYDGALGPGTGSFFVFTLVGLLGYSFLEASAKARLANWATNLGALLVFVPQGAVLWKVGLVMGALQPASAATSARARRSRAARGSCGSSSSSWSRAFIVRIGGEVLGLWRDAATSPSPATASAEIEVKRSRFLCTLVPGRGRGRPPAPSSSGCAASTGTPGTTARRSCSGPDARGASGPATTASRPAPRARRCSRCCAGAGVSDVVAVVTRWFGGTLLGAGGLVRAYGDAVRAGLEATGTRRAPAAPRAGPGRRARRRRPGRERAAQPRRDGPRHRRTPRP